jgi:hypothetical protein
VTAPRRKPFQAPGPDVTGTALEMELEAVPEPAVDIDPHPPEPEAPVALATPPPKEKIDAEIRETAFYRYEGRLREGQQGDHMDDWLAAEREVMDRWHSPLEDLAPPRWGDSPRRNWGK